MLADDDDDDDKTHNNNNVPCHLNKSIEFMVVRELSLLNQNIRTITIKLELIVVVVVVQKDIWNKEVEILYSLESTTRIYEFKIVKLIYIAFLIKLYMNVYKPALTLTLG